MAKFHQIVPQSAAITCHAWNRNGDMLALCPNNNELHIYEECSSEDFKRWKRSHVLDEHDMLISSISWSHANDKIVTCSHDRNAFVWKFDGTRWNPTLCILRIDRAANCVEWSPDGKKFAVASSSKCVPVSYHDTSQYTDWYVSKMIKKHRSSVLQLAWHPNSQIIATVSSDKRCRIISAAMSEVDTEQDAGPFASGVPFGEVFPNAEFTTNAWTTAVAWNPSGSSLVFSSHSSTVHIVELNGGNLIVKTLDYPYLPMSCLLFFEERAFIGCGYDMEPILFSSDFQGTWHLETRLDTDQNVSLTAGGASNSSGSSTNISAARAMFQAKASRGTETAEDATALLKTNHRNAITCVRQIPQSSEVKISTTGADGMIGIWDLDSLIQKMKKMKM